MNAYNGANGSANRTYTSSGKGTITKAQYDDYLKKGGTPAPFNPGFSREEKPSLPNFALNALGFWDDIKTKAEAAQNKLTAPNYSGSSGSRAASGGKTAAQLAAEQAAAQRAAQMAAQQAAIQNQYDQTQAELNRYLESQKTAAQSWYDQSVARLAQQLAEQKAAEQAAREQMAAQQLAGYNQNVETANKYYGDIYGKQDANYQSQLAAAQQDFEAALALLQRNHEAGTGQVNAVTDKSLQEAYIQSMMAKRNMGQELAALGRSGGASETALLGLSNQYGQNRGTLETQRGDQLQELALQLAGQQAQNQEAYGQRKQGYEDQYTQLRNQYQAEQAAKLADYKQAYDNYLSNWDQQSLARQQGYESDYTNSLTAAQLQYAQQQADIEQYVQQALLAARQAMMQQQAALLAAGY